MALKAIKPAPYNPRVTLKPGDAEFEKLRRSIEKFGLVEPIVVNKRTGHAVGGHQRLGVLKQLGYDQVDVAIVDMPLDQEKALNIALNKISGRWDQDKLTSLMADLANETPDLAELTGFDSQDIDNFLADAQESLSSAEGSAPDAPADPKPDKEKKIPTVHAVTVEVDDEEHQKAVYDLLKANGYDRVRLTTVN